MTEEQEQDAMRFVEKIFRTAMPATSGSHTLRVSGTFDVSIERDEQHNVIQPAKVEATGEQNS